MKLAAIALVGLSSLATAFAAVVGPASGTVDGVQPATVLEVNPAGIGHVNLVPYFTVRSGFDTYLNLVNTDTHNGKAVKVRLRSAVDGIRVGDFTVLLAPGDTWAAALTRDAATGLPRVVHSDRSCTLPANVRTTLGSSDYYLWAFPPAHSEAGSVEIITLADIPPLLPGGSASPLFATIKAASDAAGAACSPATLQPLATDSTSYADARSKGLAVPTSGLMTQWTLINVPRAVSYTGRATAVEARVAAGGTPGYGNIVLFPQTSVRVYESGRPARVASYTTNPVHIGGGPFNFDNNAVGLPSGHNQGTYFESELPDLSTPYLQSGLNPGLPPGAGPRLQAFAISKALATNSLTGEFLTEPSILAKTDWVVTMPTRYLSAKAGYIGPFVSIGYPDGPSYTNLTLDIDQNVLGMGTRNFFQRDTNTRPAWGYGRLCVSVSRVEDSSMFASREGLPLPVQSGTGSAMPMELCGHTTVLRFGSAADDGVLGEWNTSDPWSGDGNGVLGAANTAYPLLTTVNAGWARIQIPGIAGIGLPIIGFAVSELYNGAVTPGTAGVFGQVFPLGTTKPAP